MYKLVLIRHGESTWNLENRFTGWTDVDLTPTGVEQAKNAGRNRVVFGEESSSAVRVELSSSLGSIPNMRTIRSPVTLKNRIMNLKTHVKAT